MQYMGGKAKIAKKVVGAILDCVPERRVWFEPFVGGGNVLEHAAPHFDVCYASDIKEDLVLMWQALQAGWIPPECLTKERYHELRHAKPSGERGFAGFGASFGGKWFAGYGVSPRDGEVCRASYRTVLRQTAKFGRVVFTHRPYHVAPQPPVDSVVYCDPPYIGTTAYSTGSFNHAEFYRTLQLWAAHCAGVFVSEYTAPTVPHQLIWEGGKRAVLDKTGNDGIVTERLFRIYPDGE